VPVSQAQRFGDAITNGKHELLVLEGADHCFTEAAAMYEVAARVLAFLCAHKQ
jgi:esterase/lipase